MSGLPQGLRSSILTPADYAALAENDDDSSCESITPASTRCCLVMPAHKSLQQQQQQQQPALSWPCSGLQQPQLSHVHQDPRVRAAGH